MYIWCVCGRMLAPWPFTTPSWSPSPKVHLLLSFTIRESLSNNKIPSNFHIKNNKEYFYFYLAWFCTITDIIDHSLLLEILFWLKTFNIISYLLTSGLAISFFLELFILYKPYILVFPSVTVCSFTWQNFSGSISFTHIVFY